MSQKSSAPRAGTIQSTTVLYSYPLLLPVEGMPLGVQIIGQWHEDARATAMAAWVAGVA